MNRAALKYDRDHCSLRGSIKRVTKRKSEDNFMVNASVVLFLNRGQNYLLLDDQVLIEPGGFHKETNVCTDYSWRFIENLDPPAVNKPLVFPGNHLSIRIGNASESLAMDMDMVKPVAAGNTSTGGTVPNDINLTAFGNITNADFHHTCRGHLCEGPERRVHDTGQHHHQWIHQPGNGKFL